MGRHDIISSLTIDDMTAKTENGFVNVATSLPKALWYAFWETVFIQGNIHSIKIYDMNLIFWS